jgi:hypothetical protein
MLLLYIYSARDLLAGHYGSTDLQIASAVSENPEKFPQRREEWEKKSKIKKIKLIMARGSFRPSPLSRRSKRRRPR